MVLEQFQTPGHAIDTDTLLPRNTSELDLLDPVGEEGWELVAITSNKIAYLKREIPKRLTRKKD